MTKNRILISSALVFFGFASTALAETTNGWCDLIWNDPKPHNRSESACYDEAFRNSVTQSKQNCYRRTGRFESFDVKVYDQRWHGKVFVRYACTGLRRF